MNKEKCYSPVTYNSDATKIWYNQYRGYIVKSWIEPGSNIIHQEKVPYNQPNNFIHFLNDYFTYKIN